MSTLLVENPVTIKSPAGTAKGPWSTDFTCSVPADVAVYYRLDDDKPVKLTLTADYTLSGATPETTGYSVTLTQLPAALAAWPAGAKVIIARATDILQNVEYSDTLGVKPSLVKAMGDKQARIAQEHGERLNRSTLAPYGEAGLLHPTLSKRKGMISTYDKDTGELNADRSLDAFDADVQSAADNAAATEADRLATFAARDDANTAKADAQSARNDAQVARDEAEAFAISISPGTPDGVGTLGADGIQTPAERPIVPRSKLDVGMSSALMPSPMEDGALADNVQDDRPAFVLTDAKGSWYIPDGTYKIASNFTPSKSVRIASLAKFYIADGVTVDFSNAQPEIHAPHKQRFYFPGAGTGQVIGLHRSAAGWFAGDKLNVATSALSELNKWAGSVITGGRLDFVLGTLYTDGSDYIQCAAGQNVRGKCRKTSQLRMLTTTTKGFRFSVASRPEIHDITIQVNNSLVASVAGEGILFEAACLEWEATSILTGGLYVAIKSFANRGKAHRLTLNSSLYSAMWLDTCVDADVHHSVFAATSSWMTLTGITGTFLAETITWTGGGSGTISAGSGGNYSGSFSETAPTPGTVITGSTSGATATVATIQSGHQGGALRLREQAEAHTFTVVEFAGGDYGLLTGAVSNTTYHRGLENRWIGCYFDNNKIAGASVNQAVSCKFSQCWFSDRPGDNCVVLTDTNGIIFEGCTWVNIWKRALLATATAKNTQIIGGGAWDVNKSNTAGADIFLFSAGATGSMRDVVIGDTFGYGGYPGVANGVRINAGAVVTLDNVDGSYCGTAIADASGGTAKIKNCKGYNTVGGGSATFTTDASGLGTINHGCGATPVIANLTIVGNVSHVAHVISIGTTAINVKVFTTGTTPAGLASTSVTIMWEAKCASALP